MTNRCFPDLQVGPSCGFSSAERTTKLISFKDYLSSSSFAGFPINFKSFKVLKSENCELIWKYSNDSLVQIKK